MKTDYNNFSKTFAASRRNMKWEELEYFFGCIKDSYSILDIGCGSGRFLEGYNQYFGKLPDKYLGIDLSKGLLDEAKKTFPNQDFQELDMLELKKIAEHQKFESIFLIASFHHLDSLEKREKVLSDLKKILEKGACIYMTNWALESTIHKEKYAHLYIKGSENKFKSKDFNIKFGKFDRYYHSFSLEELKYLGERAGLTLEENRLFDTQKNMVTVFKK